MISNLDYRLFLIFSLLCLSASTKAQEWQTFMNRADSLEKAGAFPEAIEVANQALKQAETTFSKDHPSYARSLLRLGSLQLEKGDYSDAKINFIASRDLYKKLNLTRDTSYAEVLVGFGVLNRIQGVATVAEASLVEALHITKQLKGRESLTYINTLGSLGNLYSSNQQFRQAEKTLLEVLDLRTKKGDTGSNDYANTLNSLGLVYLNLEDYVRSEAYFQEGLQIWERLLGVNHPNVGAILGNMGLLFIYQGAYEKALIHLLKAKAIQELKSPGSFNHIVAIINTALAYTRLKQYKTADTLYRNVLPMVAEKLGATHQQNAIIQNNLGFIAEAQGHYFVALDQYQKALELYNGASGAETMGGAEMMSNIGSTYYAMKQFGRADSMYRKSLTIMERQVGKNGLRYAGTLNYHGHLLSEYNKLDSAVVKIANAQVIIDQNLSKNFLLQTSSGKASLLNRWVPFIQSSFDIASNHPLRPDAAKLAYSGSLFLKNLLLSQHISLFGGDAQNVDNKLRLLTDTLRQVSNLVATQYTLPIAQRKNLDSLEARAESLEKDLARQSAPFREAQRALQVRWEDVRDALKPGEAAVEFVSFPYHNGRQQTDTVRYLALVLRPGDVAPQVVPLLRDEAPLRRLLARKTGASTASTLYVTRGFELDTDQLTRGDSLYQLVWQPLDKLLTDAKTVYLSPSGLLHQVAFAALPYGNKTTQKAPRYLADRYQLRQVGSTRQVATQTKGGDTYQSLNSATLYGGIHYDSVATTGARTGAWSFLPGSEREVSQITQFIGPKATLITGSAATETAFKAQSGQSPTVLHMATHGFAFPDPLVAKNDSSAGVQKGGNTFRQIANPLFRTGLLMAGANRVWQGGRPPLGQDDGILTAYEVANLNLSNTKLVVLSACETALGDIRGSEGVFGLQRAFKMAGADYLLMSLWPVSDQVTSDLMTQFYRNWKKHKTIRAAYEQTQAQMRQKYPPTVWAAFVLVE